MKITIGPTTYTAISDLHFAPEVDVSCDTVPLCCFEATIKTADNPILGSWAVLTDNNDLVYARYVLAKTERLDSKRLRVLAYSTLYLLESGESLQQYVDNESASVVFDAAFAGVAYTLDPVLASGVINGYAATMKVRELVHLLCDAVGGYVSQAFRQDIGVLRIPSTAVLVPMEDTYMQPEITYDSPASRVTAYINYYTELPPGQRPDNGEEWILIGSTYYTVSKGWSTATNPDFPEGTPARAIDYDNSLVTADNYSDYVTRKAALAFSARTIEADIINDGQYAPGDRVMLYTSRNTIVSGIIASEDFVFGSMHNRCHIKLVGVEDVSVGGAVTIRYIWEGTGAVLEIENYYPDEATIRYKTRYLDKELEDGHRYVFRPAVRYVDIAVTSSEQTVDINCTVALDYYQGILHILSVDAEHTTVESEKTILVIGGAPSGNTGATGGSS